MSIPPPPLPTYLILGGTGYVGANLTMYLHTHSLASRITIADLKPPGRCFLPQPLLDLYADKTLEFIQTDAQQDAHLDRLFTDRHFDIIIDCIAETRTGMSDDVVFTKIVKPIQKVIEKVKQITASEAYASNPPFFIELSTAQVYDPTSKPVDETGKCKPWTVVARAKYEIELQLKAAFADNSIQGCILRPSLIYGGFNEFRSIAPRLCTAAVYQRNGDKMEFLWTKNLAINTVHVEDVSRAIYWVGGHQKYCNKGILNLSDGGNTTQGSFNTIIEALFGIKTDFAGSILSNLAKLKLEQITNDANDTHQPQWLSLARDGGIENTPYTTYISMELLYNNNLCIDGTSITRLVTAKDKVGVPFEYSYPAITHQLVYQPLMDAIARNLFPKIKLNPPVAK